MPAQTSQSPLLAKYGNQLREAWLENRSNETEYSNFGDLPPGVEGIAQLTECTFQKIKEGKENAGEYIFMAAGVCLTPLTFTDKQGNVHQIEGKHTRIIESVFPTPNKTRKTIKEHFKWIVNELQKLGADTSKVDEYNIEALATAVKKSRPFFRYRTWQGPKATTGQYKDKEPQTTHFWEGLSDPPKEGEATHQTGGGRVNDDTGSVAPPPARNGATRQANAAPANGASGGGAVQGAETAAGGENFTEFEDIPTLVAKSSNGDEAAQGKLIEMALEAGVEQQAVTDAKTWDDLANMIAQASGGGDGSASGSEVPPEEWKPVKGNTCKYRVIDAKTGKPAVDPRSKKERKPVDCEITAVDTKTNKVNLKSIDDGKTEFNGVPIAALIHD